MTTETLAKLGIGAIIILGFVSIIIVVGKADKIGAERWDKCQTRFEQSGAPMEARDGIMRGCFAE